VLLKRGIYALCEFVPDGLDYEALLIFFTDDFAKKFLHIHISYQQQVELPALLILLFLLMTCSMR
jgi:AraC family transcriptional regulator, exoenzyme S synthesis regulatory protein ExsA